MKMRKILGGIFSAILCLITIFFLLVLVCEIVVNSVYIKTSVQGFSMYPTINETAYNAFIDWDTVYVNQYREIKINDIVVARVDWKKNAIIKRVIAGPFDSIQIRENSGFYELYVNDILQSRREITGETKKSITTSSGEEKEITISKGTQEYFDLYNKFLENEQFSDLIKENEFGKYIQLKADQYFLSGDNWGGSTDSFTHGPILTSNIIGRVDLILKHGSNSILEFSTFFLKSLFAN